MLEHLLILHTSTFEGMSYKFKNVMRLFTILLLMTCSSLISCQSEYGERMSKALMLKEKYNEVQSLLFDTKNPYLEIQLSEIEKEIKFHATLSGNETHFLEQVWGEASN